MKNVAAICMNELMEKLRLSNIEVSESQHEKCLDTIQSFFFSFPEYDEEQAPKEYMLDFQISLCETIEDICFEVFEIKNRDKIFRISDSVTECFMDCFENDIEDSKLIFGLDKILELKEYEDELKDKGIEAGMVCLYPRIYRMALQNDEKALELVKILELE